jgi:hypothetical protein
LKSLELKEFRVGEGVCITHNISIIFYIYHDPKYRECNWSEEASYESIYLLKCVKLSKAVVLVKYDTPNVHCHYLTIIAEPPNQDGINEKHLKVAYMATAVAVFTFGVTYASVPLYKVFCQVLIYLNILYTSMTRIICR